MATQQCGSTPPDLDIEVLETDTAFVWHDRETTKQTLQPFSVFSASLVSCLFGFDVFVRLSSYCSTYFVFHTLTPDVTTGETRHRSRDRRYFATRFRGAKQKREYQG